CSLYARCAIPVSHRKSSKNTLYYGMHTECFARIAETSGFHLGLRKEASIYFKNTSETNTLKLHKTTNSFRSVLSHYQLFKLTLSLTGTVLCTSALEHSHSAVLLIA